MKRFCVLLILVFCWQIPVEGTISLSLSFDPPAMPGGDVHIAEYVEDNMTLSTTNGLIHRDSGSGASYADNGSAYVIFPGTMTPLVIRHAQAGAFSLESIDLAEYSSVVAAPMLVSFTGYRTNGAVVQIDFQLDGIHDGTGPAVDFETFYFNADFQGLSRVEVGSCLYTLDNLEGTMIPEPTTGALCFCSVCILGALKLYRKSQA